MRDLGFDAAPIDPAIEAIPHDDWQARSPFAANKRVLRVFAERARHEVKDLEAAISAERPDALLVDISTEGAAALAEAGAYRWAQYTPYFVPVPSKDAPPFGLGLPPRSDPWGKVRDAMVDRALLRPLLRSDLGALNEVRRGVGAEPLHRFDDLYRRAPVHIYFTAEPFEYPRTDWPGSFRLVGPGIWEPPGERPDWLKGLDRNVVLVTCSSEFQDDGKLVDATISALAGDDLEVVATTAAVDPSSHESAGRVHVARYLSHAHILERAACVVCHGGMGITQKALMAGVPVCVVPHGRDQLEVAGHVKAAGIGTRLPRERLRPKPLRKAILAAIQQKSRVQEVSAAMRRNSGPERAADALEEILP